MKYTKNTPLKLKLIGFDFAYRHQQKEDRKNNESELHYEVWKKKIGSLSIDVTICHTDRKVIVWLESDNPVEFQGIKSPSDIQVLEKLVVGKQKQYINNEEGD
jgi:hypothetical protein